MCACACASYLVQTGSRPANKRDLFLVWDTDLSPHKFKDLIHGSHCIYPLISHSRPSVIHGVTALLLATIRAQSDMQTKTLCASASLLVPFTSFFMRTLYDMILLSYKNRASCGFILCHCSFLFQCFLVDHGFNVLLLLHQLTLWKCLIDQTHF